VTPINKANMKRRAWAWLWLLSAAACDSERQVDDASGPAADSGMRDAGNTFDAGKKLDAAVPGAGVGGKRAPEAGTGGVGGHDNVDDRDAGDAERDGGLSTLADQILRSTPGRTACGLDSDCMSYPMTSTNNEGQPYCCIAPGSRPFCGTGNLAACESGAPYYCDEAADCADAMHCCESPIRFMFRCVPSCGEQIQLCKSDSECENGLPCTAYTCNGQPLATCGALPEGFTQRPLPDREPSCVIAP
jgi:hypothetical protein